MASSSNKPTSVCHVVAMPLPGRGHINPLMNICRSLVSRTNDPSHIFITFVITEEWLGFIGSEPKPANINFATIPNVLPSELVRAADMVGFIDRLELPVNVIIADTFLKWAVDVGNRRNIPVASFWPMSASLYSIFYHFELLVENGHYPFELSGRENDRVDYIPGISSIRLADLPTLMYKEDNGLLKVTVGVVSRVHKAQYLLCPSIFELESQVIDSLKQKFSIPVYSLGPLIPYSDLKKDSLPQYMKWLDNQPQSSVLYVSLGSFLSVSSTQLDEIAAGLNDSGVRYLWVARGDTAKFRERCDGGEGMIIPWCEQLNVLCHPSVGGFWTHCGWSSTMEGVFAGVPMLTLPILMDQTTNGKFIFEDWKIGWQVKSEMGRESLMGREKIAQLVRRFMDSESEAKKDMMKRAAELKVKSQQAISKGGSSDENLCAFLASIQRT